MSPNDPCERDAEADKRNEKGTMTMKKFVTTAAGALAAVSFSAVVGAHPGSSPSGMGAEEHQQMMLSGSAANEERMMSDPNMHRRMMAMMERCEEMMAKKGKHSAFSGSGRESAKKTSAEGNWAWRPDPGQAPGPRASLRPPIRVWIPAEKSSNQ